MKKLIALLVGLSLLLPLAIGAETGGTHLKTIYFAGGCFWGTEHLFSLIPGVTDAESGYANGTAENPSYQQVCGGDTGHMETVKVTYDETRVSLETLLKMYFSVVDTTTPNRQGNDAGTQYQAGIFTVDKDSADRVNAYAAIEKNRHGEFYIRIEPLSCYYRAEEYHQDYLEKKPNGYCHISCAAFQRAKAIGKEEAPMRAEYRRVTPSEARQMKHDDQSTVILDVRTREEFAAGHIRDAVNIPLNLLPDSLHLMQKNDRILVYCRSGARSENAARFLVSQGYTGVYDLGGIISWPYEIVR